MAKRKAMTLVEKMRQMKKEMENPYPVTHSKALKMIAEAARFAACEGDRTSGVYMKVGN